MGIKSTETGPPHMKTWFVTGYIKSSGKRIDYSMNGPGKTRKEVNRWEKKLISTSCICTNDFQMS